MSSLKLHTQLAVTVINFPQVARSHARKLLIGITSAILLTPICSAWAQDIKLVCTVHHKTYINAWDGKGNFEGPVSNQRDYDVLINEKDEECNYKSCEVHPNFFQWVQPAILSDETERVWTINRNTGKFTITWHQKNSRAGHKKNSRAVEVLDSYEEAGTCREASKRF